MKIGIRLLAVLGILFFVTPAFAADAVSPPQAGEEDAVSPEEEQPKDQDKQKEEQKKKEEVEEYVITATRVKTPARNVASSVTVITAEDIQRSGKITVGDVLRDVPGLDVARNGGPGQPTSVFMRGAKSEHTLVLLDGIELNDPISPGRAFDFANLSVDNIERIEIIRGPQSTLYGSDAIGGVINIITKKGEGPPSGRVFGEYGSYNTFREGANVSGGKDWYEYSLGLSRDDSEGFSAARRRDGNHEKDGYGNTTVAPHFSIKPMEWLEFASTLRYIDSRVDLDNHGGPGGDDPNYIGHTEQTFLREQLKAQLLDGKWEQILGYSFAKTRRHYDNDPDHMHPLDSQDFRFDGRVDKIDWQHNVALHKTNTLTGGFEWERESGNSTTHTTSMFGPFDSEFEDKSLTMRSYYIQDQECLWDRWTTVVGGRIDDHDTLGVEPTGRIASRYNLKETGTSFRGSYGLGFKAPTLYQLFSEFGNPALQPEKSRGWDAGIEQEILKGVLDAGATYFSNDFRNFIDFDFASMKYENIGKARANGVETYITCRPLSCISLRAWYTRTNTKDLATGEELLRRPRNVYGLDVDLSVLQDRGTISLSIMHVGRRADIDPVAFPTKRVSLHPYTLVGISGRYRVINRLTLTGRIENVLNQDYEEVKGYGVAGFSAYVGFELSF
jgi:vitamin B12 transporter